MSAYNGHPIINMFSFSIPKYKTIVNSPSVSVSSPAHFHPGSLCYRANLHRGFSIKKTFSYLLVFLFIAIVIIGLGAIVVIFLVKPQKPVFRIESFKLDSYKLDSYHGSSLLVSSFLSFFVNMQNPNKFAIRTDPSQLRIYHQGFPIGAIRVPKLYQPPKSTDLRTRARVFFDCVNVSRILTASSLKETSRNDVQMKVLGDVRARISMHHITLLKFKVGLDCDVDFDYKQLMFEDEFRTLKFVHNKIASFPTKSKSFSKKCNLAFYLWRHKFT